jgi:hypothetical protein
MNVTDDETVIYEEQRVNRERWRQICNTIHSTVESIHVVTQFSFSTDDLYFLEKALIDKKVHLISLRLESAQIDTLLCSQCIDILSSQLNTLKEFSLRKNRIGDEGLQMFSELFNSGTVTDIVLEILDLSSNDITDLNMEHFCKSLENVPRLSSLLLYGNKLTVSLLYILYI